MDLRKRGLKEKNKKPRKFRLEEKQQTLGSGWDNGPKNVKSSPLGLVNVTLCEKRVFEVVLNLMTLR